ncbi:hypothetical protein TNCV_4011341 [Trichonephila clavipes]|nr:hypothetical protein TNCV_4011341 [Trichonephila clavipes]
MLSCNLSVHALVHKQDWEPTSRRRLTSTHCKNSFLTSARIVLKSTVFVFSLSRPVATNCDCEITSGVYSFGFGLKAGIAIRGFSSGRPRGNTPADDRCIVLQARINRRQTAGEIARHTAQATGRPISRFTVARRLHGGGLFARRPVRCVPLTPAHRRRRSLR